MRIPPRRAFTAANNNSSYVTRDTRNQEEASQVQLMDELDLFEQLRQELLPEIRQALIDGKPSSEILETGKRYAAARIASMVVLEGDSARALAAAKELLDRVDGKATERKEFTHKLGKMRDEELDALLITATASEESDGDSPEDK